MVVLKVINMTREQMEKSLVADIQLIAQMPIDFVTVRHWTDKIVFPAVKITVYAGLRSFVLEDIPGNASSLDIVVDGKPWWVTGRESVNAVFQIRKQLLEQYDTKTKE